MKIGVTMNEIMPNQPTVAVVRVYLLKKELMQCRQKLPLADLEKRTNRAPMF